MEHTVRKSRKNRIALRVVAFLFLAIAVCRLVVVFVSKEPTNRLVTIILCGTCFTYGLYTLIGTLKSQAYDITYVFGDKQFTLKMHRREKTYSYGEITDLGFVVPSPNIDYCIVQIFIGREQYTIPFSGAGSVGEALYGMLKIKQDEAVEKETTVKNETESEKEVVADDKVGSK